MSMLTSPNTSRAAALILLCTAACGEEDPPAKVTTPDGGTALDSGTGGDSSVTLEDSGAGDSSTGIVDSSTPITEDAGVIPDPVDAGDDPLAPLQGDYLIRFHTVSTANQPPLGNVTADSTSYGVMRVVLENGTLVGTERLCHGDVIETADNGNVETSVPSQTWENLTPVKRTLLVDEVAGTWTSPEATRRQGWKETAAAMPTDPATQADDFLDPDEDGAPGVATRVSGSVLIISVDCTYDIVSYATTTYAGVLTDDGIGHADITATDADVHALTAEGTAPMGCSVADINEGPDDNTTVDEVDFARVADTWLADAEACPSVAEFEAAFP